MSSAPGSSIEARCADLPVDAVLVRGGISTLEDMAHSAAAFARRTGSYGLTFWSWPELTAEEIAVRVREQARLSRSKNPLPHTLLRSTAAGALLVANEAFRLAKTGADGHYTLYLPVNQDVTQVTAESLISSDHGNVFTEVNVVLGDPASNPAKGVFDDVR